MARQGDIAHTLSTLDRAARGKLTAVNLRRRRRSASAKAIYATHITAATSVQTGPTTTTCQQSRAKPKHADLIRQRCAGDGSYANTPRCACDFGVLRSEHRSPV